jgi:hypothetical protein
MAIQVKYFEGGLVPISTGIPAILTRNVRGLLQALKANVLILTQSDQRRFIAKVFQFISRQSLSHSMLYDLG